MTDQRGPTREEIEERAREEEFDRANREVIARGVEAQKFLNSKVAEFITDIAEAKVQAAMDKLTNVNPNDTEQIIELQGVIKQFRHYERCLGELVAAGQTAYELYIEQHSTE